MKNFPENSRTQSAVSRRGIIEFFSPYSNTPFGLNQKPVLMVPFIFAVAAASAAVALPGPPVPNPAHPEPNWSWDTVPLAFHGANRSGAFSDLEIDLLAR